MIFPELVERAKDFLVSRGGTPTLGLKGMGGVTFDAVNVAWYARNGFQGLYSILGGGLPAWSGETVGLETSLNHSVVWACNRVISEPVGFIPLVMMQRTSRGKQPAESHPIYSALHDAPNDETTAQVFRETTTSHTVMQGGGFAQIIRRSGTGVAVELRQLLPTQVITDREKTGQKRLIYQVRESSEAAKTYTVVPGQPQDILHIRGIGFDGIRGYSVLTMARQSIGTALARERNVAKFYANGGRVPYLLTREKDFKSDAEFEKFRADWEAIYSQPHKAPILTGGMKYDQIGLDMADQQLLEMGQFQIPEICRWFNVSPHIVGDLSRATFSNIEQLALEFVKMTLAAWLTRWEQELWRCVLTPEEKTQGYYFRHNVNALLRGDFVSRMAGYASALQNGHMNQDEVRDLEDRDPLPNGEGEHYRVQLNMQTLTPDGQPIVDPAAAHLAAVAKTEAQRKAA